MLKVTKPQTVATEDVFLNNILIKKDNYVC